MFLWFGALTFAVSFFLLRNKGSILRHLLAFMLAATVVPFLAMAAFHTFHPLGGRPSYSSPQVWEAQQLATVTTGAAIVLGLIAGILVTMLVRRKNRETEQSAAS